MDLGAQSQTEVKLGMIEARRGAKMNSALPYINPHSDAKGSERLSPPPMAPTCAPCPATFLQPTRLPPACPPGGAGPASLLGPQVSVILPPRPELSLHPGVQAEL